MKGENLRSEMDDLLIYHTNLSNTCPGSIRLTCNRTWGDAWLRARQAHSAATGLLRYQQNGRDWQRVDERREGETVDQDQTQHMLSYHVITIALRSGTAMSMIITLADMFSSVL